MTPTSDDIAIAICAACRETGGDPIACAFGAACTDATTQAMNMPTTRARHYALHALVHIFPKIQVTKLCLWVGSQGNPKVFWANSLHNVIKVRAGGNGHVARWFDDSVLDRVIRAIEADRTRRNVAPPAAEPPPYKPPDGTIEKVLADATPTRPRNLGTVDHSVYRPPAGTLERVLRDELEASPVFYRGGQFSERKPRHELKIKRKSDMQEELRRAIVNTAKLQEGP